MAKGAGPFSVALQELRGRLRRGDIAPGSVLVIDDLARSFEMSTTPVREALSRLAGEGLIADDRGRGFTARRLDADDLSVLYGLHAHVVDLALERAVPLCPCGPETKGRQERGGDPVKRRDGHETIGEIELFWTAIVGSSHNEDLRIRHAVLNDRLVMAREAEAYVFADFGAEWSRLMAAAADGRLQTLRPVSMAYHNRRRKKARVIAAHIAERHAERIYE